MSFHQLTAKDFEPYKKVNVLPEYIRKGLVSINISKLLRFQWLVLKYLRCLDRSNFPGDLILQAPTGTGKTLCYVIPILRALHRRKSRPCLRALVIVPTRELVNQVYSVFKSLAGETDLKILGFSGDISLASERNKAIESFNLLQDDRYSPSWKVDILISTPGRLFEHINQRNGFRLETIEFLILDETDRLLSGQSLDWIETLLSQLLFSGSFGNSDDAELFSIKDLGLKKPLRKLLFSATQTNSIAKLTNLFLVNPTLFTYTENRLTGSSALENCSSVKPAKQKYWLPSGLEEFVLLCKSPIEKLVSLVWYLEHLDSPLSETGVLVFASSKTSVHRLSRFLSLYFSANHIDSNNTVHVAELSSDLSKRQRRNVVRDFSLRKLQVVVGSDVATRGMDMESVVHVVNFDVPIHVKTYLHRVGRTARAGQKGTGCTILLQHQAHHFRKLLGEIDRTVTNSKLLWKEMNDSNVDWSNLRASVMEIVPVMQFCIQAESRKLISSRKPLTETLRNFLLQLGKKYYGVSHGQSDSERNRRKLMSEELQRFVGSDGNF